MQIKDAAELFQILRSVKNECRLGEINGVFDSVTSSLLTLSLSLYLNESPSAHYL